MQAAEQVAEDVGAGRRRGGPRGARAAAAAPARSRRFLNASHSLSPRAPPPAAPAAPATGPAGRGRRSARNMSSKSTRAVLTAARPPRARHPRDQPGDEAGEPAVDEQIVTVSPSATTRRSRAQAALGSRTWTMYRAGAAPFATTPRCTPGTWPRSSAARRRPSRRLAVAPHVAARGTAGRRRSSASRGARVPRGRRVPGRASSPSYSAACRLGTPRSASHSAVVRSSHAAVNSSPGRHAPRQHRPAPARCRPARTPRTGAARRPPAGRSPAGSAPPSAAGTRPSASRRRRSSICSAVSPAASYSRRVCGRVASGVRQVDAVRRSGRRSPASPPSGGRRGSASRAPAPP